MSNQGRDNIIIKTDVDACQTNDSIMIIENGQPHSLRETFDHLRIEADSGFGQMTARELETSQGTGRATGRNPEHIKSIESNPIYKKHNDPQKLHKNIDSTGQIAATSFLKIDK